MKNITKSIGIDSCKVAAIMVNYNGIEDTKEAIDSIQKQNMKVEIVVVDNASTGGDAKELETIYPEIKVISSQKNLGFAGGNNLGIEYALKKGIDYILMLNNDTIIDIDMITYLLAEANENTISVPAMYYFSEPDTLWYGGGTINKWTGKAEHQKLTKKQKCSFATGCCMLIHRNVFEHIGKMNEEYFMYCEDVDYSIQLNKAGIAIMYVPEAKLWHKVGKSSGGSESALSIYYLTRNRLTYIKKYKSYFFWTAFPYSILSRYIRMYQLIIKGKPEWRVYKKAITDYRKQLLGSRDCYKK